MRVLLALAVLSSGTLAAGALRAQSATDIRGIEQCLTKLPANTPPGLDHLRPICPDLEQIIAASGIEDQLGDRWRERLGPQGLKDLAGLMQRYQTAPAGAGPDPAALTAIANSLRAPQTHRSWWQRFADWLRHQLLRPTGSSSDGWLRRLLSAIPSVPAVALRLLFYLALTAVLLLAALIVWRELKIAGIGRRMPGTSQRRRTLDLPVSMVGSLKLADLDAASPSDRPLILSRLLVQALADAGRIQRERSLTYRELAQQGAFDSSEQQQQFARVSWLAEQRLYGPAQSSQAAGATPEVEQTVLDGRRLYARLAADSRAVQ